MALKLDQGSINIIRTHIIRRQSNYIVQKQ